MARSCPDCDTEMGVAEPVEYYDETPLKLRTDQPSDGTLGRVLGLNKNPQVVGYLCPNCGRVLLYGKGIGTD